ncbi:MAG: transposon-encoded TnpW family protein [Oscillospiraceae bacterium]|nr:transposon-encoded TnpW family protein [Oscillospiraceae bacterium]
MIRNVCRNTTIVNEDTTSLAPNISEYKIGHTTYIVETHFNLGCKETLDDIIKRLILRDVEALQYAA